MHIDLFEKRTIKSFSKVIQQTANLLTISGNYRLIGSASYKNIKYWSDIDLNEKFINAKNTPDLLNEIYSMFLHKYNIAINDPTIFIVDLKLGMNKDGEEIHWDYNDVKKGTKDGLTFQECILMKTTFKLDVIKIIDNVFIEFSDNYFIKLGNDANYFPSDFSKTALKNGILHAFEEYYYAVGNKFKGLKRAFSFYKLVNPQKNKAVLESLFKFFNSSTGLLYKLNSELNTLILILSNNFKEVEINLVKKNLEIINKELTIPKLKNSIQKIINNKITREKMAKMIQEISDKLLDIINKKTEEFIKANPRVLLY